MIPRACRRSGRHGTGCTGGSGDGDSEPTATTTADDSGSDSTETTTPPTTTQTQEDGTVHFPNGRGAREVWEAAAEEFSGDTDWDVEDLVPVEDDDLGEVRTHAAVPKLSGTPGEVRRLGGSQGEHNEAIYRDRLGLDEATYERLVEEEVI